MKKYLIRAPIFPINYLDKLYNSSDTSYYIINFFCNNALFKESIYIYSRILYQEASKYHKISDEKKKDKIVNSLIKYYLRMCYRPTPFGISAGVSVVDFETTTSKNSSFSNRSVRIDSAIYYNIIKEINLIKDVRNHIIYYINNTIVKNGLNYNFIDRTLKANSFDFALSKVEINQYLSKVLKNSSNGITFVKFLKLFEEEGYFQTEEIEDFFYELIDKELIISELHYDILDLNFQNKFLDKIINLNLIICNHELTSIIKTLQSVNNIISELKSTVVSPMVNCLEKYIEIDNLLKKYNNSETTSLQIDLVCNNFTKIDAKFKDSFESNFNTFLKLNSIISNSNKLDKFKAEFINRYGSRSVPLLEVLDMERGIGYPLNINIVDTSLFLENFKIITENYQSQLNLTEWDNFVLKKYMFFLEHKFKSIDITDLDLASIQSIKIPSNTTYLFSGEFLKTEFQDIFYIDFIRKGAAHFTAGRFSYANNEIKEYVHEIVNFENSINTEDFVYAEIKHFSQPRIGNIASRPCFYHYYISIYDPPSDIDKIELFLDDLYLSVYNNSIILFSKKLNKRIIPKLSCAQNTTLLTSSVYNFLCQLSEDNFINYWNWGILKDKSHLPRIMYKNYILSKEQWILKSDNIFKQDTNIKDLKNYLIQNKINRYVTLTNGGDNYLPLDLENNLSLYILTEEIIKFKSVYLLESLCHNSNTSISKEDLDIFNYEVQIPYLIKNMEFDIDSNKISKNIYSNDIYTLVKKKYFPSNNCLYFKIYIKNSQIDKLFIFKLNELVLKFTRNKSINYFYFIRYLDPEYHFRLRFFSNSLDINFILCELNKHFKNEIEMFLIDKIILDTYEPEIERYGGGIGLLISEKIFYYDSLCVLKALTWINENDLLKDKWIVAMQGVNYLFNDFGKTCIEKISILSKLKDYYYINIKNKQGLNKQIHIFYNVNKIQIFNDLDEASFELKYFKYFKERSIKLKILIDKLIVNNIDFKIEDYIHMFLNRFFESNPNQQEMIIYDLLIRYYKTILYKQIT